MINFPSSPSTGATFTDGANSWKFDGTKWVVNSVKGKQLVVLGSDITNNNGSANTIASVTGLSFAVLSGVKYWFSFNIWYTAAAGATGSRWSVSGPASPTMLAYMSRYSLTTTTETLNQALTAYDLPAAANVTSPNTTGGNLAVVEGFIQPSSSGTLIARLASEVASSAIVAKAGSFGELMVVG